MLLRGVISGSYKHNYTKVNLITPLNINVAKLASYFTGFEYCNNCIRDNVITESIINRRGHANNLLLIFSDKNNDGYTSIATHYSPSQLAGLFINLPLNLSQPLKKALMGTALEIPSAIVETVESDQFTEKCRNTFF